MHDFKDRLEILNQVSIIYRMYSHDANVADSISESDFLIKDISFPVFIEAKFRAVSQQFPLILHLTYYTINHIAHRPLPIAHCPSPNFLISFCFI